MSHYSPERKKAILKKLLPPHNRTVAEVSASEGISTATLYNWRSKAKLEGIPVPGHSKSSDDWSAEAKFTVVVETTTLTESKLSEYCRKKVYILNRSNPGKKILSLVSNRRLPVRRRR